ncbi:hypothetical protein [Streptomyces boncukensis]|uniref:Uncharacterized protein n=1 Tax=Streptomyces boncukensis TaxID=2711219 RepID=A0A6G4X023_9ACTN|nr:hypothetical protein [Streptomyces boncukensis]NGO70899.1 hypothetical protein [Streptomyces boncukensis]
MSGEPAAYQPGDAVFESVNNRSGVVQQRAGQGGYLVYSPAHGPWVAEEGDLKQASPRQLDVLVLIGTYADLRFPEPARRDHIATGETAYAQSPARDGARLWANSPD